MFEEMSRLAERLSRVAPTEAEVADPDQPLPDRMRALVDELAMQQRVTAASEGRSMVIMAELCKWAEQWQHIHDPKLLDELGADDLVAAEIAPALHLAPVTAAIRIRTAVDLVSRLPDTLAAMCRGDLDKGRVLAIRDATEDLDDALTARVEQRVLPGAVDQTAGELRRALTKAVIAVDPEAAERRRTYAVRDRSVSRWTRRDGTGAVEAVLSAVDSGEIYDLIDEVARRTKTTQDTRSMAARRADAFVHLFLGRDPHLGLDDDPPPGPAPSDRELPPDPADTDIRPEPGWPAGGGDDHQGFDQPAAPDHATGPVDQDERAWDEPVLGEPVLVEPVLGEPVLGEPALVEPADLEPPGPTRSERISELAALALAAMTSRRPPRLPWVAIN
ncbi:MAG: 13E12 repeat family protein, partial [Actinomycetota bacterium]|nr:13E12 repeat family protein [Actinomycetota bacterium]